MWRLMPPKYFGRILGVVQLDESSWKYHFRSTIQKYIDVLRTMTILWKLLFYNILLMEEIPHQGVDTLNFIPLFTGFYTSQVVIAGFLNHQQYFSEVVLDEIMSRYYCQNVPRSYSMRVKTNLRFPSCQLPPISSVDSETLVFQQCHVLEGPHAAMLTSF